MLLVGEECFRAQSGLDLAVGSQRALGVGEERQVLGGRGLVYAGAQPVALEQRLAQIAEQGPHREIAVEQIAEIVRRAAGRAGEADGGQ